MKVCDLDSGAARLDLARKTLATAVAEADMHWNDDASRRFQDTYLLPLDAKLREALEAIRRLAQVISDVEHECGPS